MDPFQRAELLQDRALLQKGVILTATQVDFIIVLMTFPAALALSLMALLPSVSVGSSLILQNSDSHPEVSPHSPRCLLTKSRCPLLQIPSADSGELLGRPGKS